MTDIDRELVEAARAVRARSHSPYSRFRVGAALRDASGAIHLGTNVENASFGLSICAERTAVGRAVTDGVRDFTAIAVCADGAEPTPPCGACRQVLMEFGPGMTVYLAGERGADGPVKVLTAAELLPEAFTSFTPGGEGEDA
jgi:cytidine deaminase